MIVLFDTSVLNASLSLSHVHHAETRAWLDRAQAGAFEWIVSTHTLAEVYATLTRMKLQPRILPRTAYRLIEDNITAYARMRALSPDEYRDLLDQLSTRNLFGGVVYDAVIAHVARLEAVDHLLTLNVNDFVRVFWDNPSAVISPLTSNPP
jgi:predicted nucleic acid-binding protein